MFVYENFSRCFIFSFLFFSVHPHNHRFIFSRENWWLSSRTWVSVNIQCCACKMKAQPWAVTSCTFWKCTHLTITYENVFMLCLILIFTCITKLHYHLQATSAVYMRQGNIIVLNFTMFWVNEFLITTCIVTYSEHCSCENFLFVEKKMVVIRKAHLGGKA